MSCQRAAARYDAVGDTQPSFRKLEWKTRTWCCGSLWEVRVRTLTWRTEVLHEAAVAPAGEHRGLRAHPRAAAIAARAARAWRSPQPAFRTPTRGNI
jgi:hypothetical protein